MGKLSLWINLTTIAALTFISAQAQTNYERKADSTPVCTQRQTENSQMVRDKSLSVAGRDPVGHKIGSSVAYRGRLLGMNWYPVDVYKQTVCGLLHHFDFYNSFGEADWNNYIIPNEAYKFIIEDVSNAKPEDIPNCLAQHDCLEVEIEPHRLFRENQWFSSSNDQTTLAGNTVCAYGPWIYEEAHGNHPEIHPAELYWWVSPANSVATSRAEWFLMQILDSSDRFSKSKQFTGSDPRPGWWHPWAESPRTGEFKIAFEIDLTAAPHSYSISQAAARNVVTSQDAEAMRDSDDGKNHAIVYNGQVVLRVFETQPAGDDLGVRFEDLCRDEANKRLNGYISITSKIAKDDQGGGFLVLNVKRDPAVLPAAEPGEIATGTGAPAGSPRVSPPTATSASFNPGRTSTHLDGIRPSLRRAIVNGQPQLVGDFQIESTTTRGGSLQSINPTVELISGGKSQTMAVQRGGAGAPAHAGAAAVLSDQPVKTTSNRSRLEGVPLFWAGDLSLRSDSGVETIALPNISLAPEVSTQTLSPQTTNEAAWQDLVRAAGGRSNSVMPIVKVVKVNEWTVEAVPSYAPRRNGRLEKEDGSVFSEEINAVLTRRDNKRLRELFAAEQPFKVEWSFKATNLVTGADVPVRVGAGASPSTVFVEKVSNSITGMDIKVTFPEQSTNAIYEVVATANMTDTYGGKGTVRQHIWSHFLTLSEPAATEDAVISSIATLAGVEAEKLLKASRMDEANEGEISMQGRQFRRARLVRLLVMRASDDKKITFEELRDLIKAAKLFGD